MSAQAKFTPWESERLLIASLLQGVAAKLSRLYDTRMEGLLPCPEKIALVSAAKPARDVIYEAQKAAYSLRLFRPFNDPFDDLPHIFSGYIACGHDSSLQKVISIARADIDEALQIFGRLMDEYQRAMAGDA